MATSQWWTELDICPIYDKVIRRGDKGRDVVEIQDGLKRIGYNILIDGDFGPTTERRVIDFQRKHGLIADGLVGPKTYCVLFRTKKNPKFLSQSDIAWAANELDVDVSSMMALNEVESRGSGFFNDKQPAILFERHVMRRELIDLKIDPKPYIANSPNIVNTATGGYKGGIAEYSRLQEAVKINQVAALRSCSWGAFQIMGFHAERLGYKDIHAFVAKMHESERNHLDAFVRFIKADKALHKSLKAKDWKDVAFRYNGKNYAKNSYDTKLKNAEVRYRSLNDLIV